MNTTLIANPKGGSVLLIDLDCQRSAAGWLG
jgi:cellulose biosynthesis protein BcsQ